ncbi:MAG: serine/threonine-protein kinase [Planctomycetaceae bacterium]
MSKEPPNSSDTPKSGEASGPLAFGKYDIQRKLGAGGMGTVYLGIDRDLKRTVALKILTKDREANPLLVKRFQSEGQTAAHLQHRNIISVYESGEIEGHLYLALEYVDGIDILQWMKKRGVLPVRRSVDIIRQVATALEHAHGKNIVHRDIKPSNIMIKADGTVKLADMGLARFMDEELDSSITRAGTTVGTVDYMSPEQARDSRAADIRSDIYSLGCSWFHMLTNRIPYPGSGITNKLRAHASEPVPDPRQFNPSVPPGVVAVIQRMMAKKPEERYQTPAELLTDLAEASLTRREVSSDLLAALASEASNLNDSSDFVLNDTNQTPLSVQTLESPTTHADVEVTMPEESDEPSTAAPSKNRKDKKAKPSRRMPAKQKSSPEPTTGVRTSRNSSVRESPSKEKLRTPPSRSTPETPLPQKQNASSGPGIQLDWNRLGWVLVAVIVIGLVIWWLVSAGSAQPGMLESLEDDPVTPVHLEEAGPPQDVAPDVVEVEPVDAATVELVDFPGLDDAGDKHDDFLSRLLPAWLREEWMRPTTHGTAVRVIDRHGQKPGSYRSLLDAAKGIGNDSITFEFTSPGPYRTGPLEFVATNSALPRDVVLRGNANVGTTLLVDVDSKEAHWLRIHRGRLHLENIHVVFVGHQNSGAESKELSLIDLQDSDLVAHNSTWSVVTRNDSASPASVTAVHVRGRSVNNNRVLLENCSVFGPLSTISVQADDCDLLCGNCLLTSTAFPLVRMSDGGDQRSVVAKESTRRIGMLSCSMYGAAGVFRFDGTPDETPAPVELRFRRSICLGTKSNSAFISFHDWPLAEIADLEHPTVDAVQLEYEHLRFINCEQLTEVDSETVSDVAHWRQFWKQPLPEEAVRNLPTASPIREFRDPDLVVQQVAPAIDVRANGDPFFGVNPESVARIAPGIHARIQAASNRRQLPDDFELVTTANSTIRFDLRRAAQFNDFLNGPQCPNGSTVICFGAGLRPLPTLKLTGKRVRIVFEQSEGRPLTLQPEADTGDDVWFDIAAGHLELVNARMKLPDGGQRQYPQTLLRLTDSSALVDQCELSSERKTASQPLIAVVNEQSELLNLLVSQSLLKSEHMLFEFGASGVNLECINSLLATSASVLQCDEHSIVPRPATEVSLFRCTSVARHVVAANSLPEDIHVRIFSRECLFLPISHDDSTAILATSSDVASGQQLDWWEADCGFSPQLAHWEWVADGTSKVSFSAAREALQPGQILDAVTSVRQVLLAQSLPELEEFVAESVALESSCAAATWAPDGGPVGIRLPIGPTDALATGTSDAPSSNPRPERFRPDF